MGSGRCSANPTVPLRTDALTCTFANPGRNAPHTEQRSPHVRRSSDTWSLAPSATIDSDRRPARCPCSLWQVPVDHHVPQSMKAPRNTDGVPPKMARQTIGVLLVLLAFSAGCRGMPWDTREASFTRCMRDSGFRVTEVEINADGGLHYSAPDVPFMNDDPNFAAAANQCIKETITSPP